MRIVDSKIPQLFWAVIASEKVSKAHDSVYALHKYSALEKHKFEFIWTHEKGAHQQIPNDTASQWNQRQRTDFAFIRIKPGGNYSKSKIPPTVYHFGECGPNCALQWQTTSRSIGAFNSVIFVHSHIGWFNEKSTWYTKLPHFGHCYRWILPILHTFRALCARAISLEFRM